MGLLYMKDINISGNSCDIDTKCSDWRYSKDLLVIRIYLDKLQLSSLEDSCRPGAVEEIELPTMRNMYMDSTWEGKNTLDVTPVSDPVSNLSNAVSQETLLVKNLKSEIIKEDKLDVKLTGYRK